MTALLLAGAVVCGVGFVVTVARHEHALDVAGPDDRVHSWFRDTLTEGLWLSPAIGCCLGAIASVLPGLST